MHRDVAVCRGVYEVSVSPLSLRFRLSSRNSYRPQPVEVQGNTIFTDKCTGDPQVIRVGKKIGLARRGNVCPLILHVDLMLRVDYFATTMFAKESTQPRPCTWISI